jgi:hypothetical protein
MYNENKKMMEGRNSLFSPNSHSKKRIIDNYYKMKNNQS